MKGQTMKAEEMFKYLGFKKIVVYNMINEVIGIKYKKVFLDKHKAYIEFNFASKSVISYYNLNESRVIEFNEFKAITQQIKELGWLE